MLIGMLTTTGIAITVSIVYSFVASLEEKRDRFHPDGPDTILNKKDFKEIAIILSVVLTVLVNIVYIVFYNTNITTEWEEKYIEEHTAGLDIVVNDDIIEMRVNRDYTLANVKFLNDDKVTETKSDVVFEETDMPVIRYKIMDRSYDEEYKKSNLLSFLSSPDYEKGDLIGVELVLPKNVERLRELKIIK